MSEVSPFLSELERRYHQFLVATHANAIISIAAQDVLRGFPDQLPEHLKVTVQESVQRLVSKLELPEDARSPGLPETVWESGLGMFAELLLTSQYFSQTGPGSPWEVQFEYRVRAQELVMLLAHLDGFMVECARIIYKACPKKLKRDKQLKWTEVIDCGTWDKVLAHMVEVQVKELCTGSMSKKLGRFRDVYDLEIRFEAKLVRLLEEADLIRNAFVHNHSLTSPELARLAGPSGTSAGDPVQLDPSLVVEATFAAQSLGGELVEAIAERFFSVKREDVPSHIAMLRIKARVNEENRVPDSE